MKQRKNKRQPSARAVQWHEAKNTVASTILDAEQLTVDTAGISAVIRNTEVMSKLNDEELSSITQASQIVINTLTDFKAQILTIKADFELISSTPHEKRHASQFEEIKMRIATVMQAYTEVILPNVERVLTLGEIAADRVEATQQETTDEVKEETPSE